MNEQLKPCPFCGGQALILKDSHISGYYALCDTCGTKTKTFMGDLALEALKDLWNGSWIKENCYSVKRA